MKRTVLFITTSVGSGGAEVMLLKLINALDRERVSPRVLVLREATPMVNELKRAGAEVTALGVRGVLGMLLALPRVVRVARQMRPQVIQGWMIHGNLVATLAAKVSGCSVVWGVRHSSLLADNEKCLTRALDAALRYISGIPYRIVYNSNDGRTHHEALGYDRRKSVVIPNGFDLAQFRIDLASRRATRAALKVGDNTVLVGMVARFHPMKDHGTFLRAAALVRRRHANTQFVLVGQGCERSNDALSREIVRHGLDGAVLLLGERRDITNIANALDIGTLSSSGGEGFPNAIGELMACGVPCVVTDVGDCAALVEGTGICVPPREPESLAQAWETMIRIGPEERRRLGAKARARLETEFSISSVARQFEELYIAAA